MVERLYVQLFVRD